MSFYPTTITPIPPIIPPFPAELARNVIDGGWGYEYSYCVLVYLYGDWKWLTRNADGCVRVMVFLGKRNADKRVKCVREWCVCRYTCIQVCRCIGVSVRLVCVYACVRVYS